MQGEKNTIKGKSLGPAIGAYRITIIFTAKYAHTYKEFGLCIYPICELVTHTAHLYSTLPHFPPKNIFLKAI